MPQRRTGVAVCASLEVQVHVAVCWRCVPQRKVMVAELQEEVVTVRGARPSVGRWHTSFGMHRVRAGPHVLSLVKSDSSMQCHTSPDKRAALAGLS